MQRYLRTTITLVLLIGAAACTPREDGAKKGLDERRPQMGDLTRPKPKPTATATAIPSPGGPVITTPTPVQSGSCDRVEYFKLVNEPCPLPNNQVGNSVWKMHCYSDGFSDPVTGECKSNGQQEYCDPNPVSTTACTAPPGQAQTPGGGSDNGGTRLD